jgi:hypothetical protein
MKYVKEKGDETEYTKSEETNYVYIHRSLLRGECHLITQLNSPTVRSWEVYCQFKSTLTQVIL